MPRRLFCAGVAVLLVVGVTLAEDKKDEGKRPRDVAFGKVVSLKLMDGTGTLVIRSTPRDGGEGKEHGELDDAVLVPVDAHPELFGVHSRSNEGTPRRRCDLLRIRFGRGRLNVTCIWLRPGETSWPSAGLVETTAGTTATLKIAV